MARSKSCVEVSTACPRPRARSRSKCMMEIRPGKSRKAVGSSSTSSSGSCASARAIITRCLSPSLSSCTKRSASWLTSVSASAFSTARSSSCERLSKIPVCGKRPKPTSSRTRMAFTSTCPVRTTLTRPASSLLLYSRSGRPLRRTSPPKAGCRRVSVRSKVDFPTPFGPARHTNSPPCRSRFKPLATTLRLTREGWKPICKSHALRTSLVIRKTRSFPCAAG